MRGENVRTKVCICHVLVQSKTSRDVDPPESPSLALIHYLEQLQTWFSGFSREYSSASLCFTKSNTANTDSVSGYLL